MEEITLEIDDETAEWLISTAVEQEKSISEIVGELIQELRASPRALERDFG